MTSRILKKHIIYFSINKEHLNLKGLEKIERFKLNMNTKINN